MLVFQMFCLHYFQLFLESERALCACCCISVHYSFQEVMAIKIISHSYDFLKSSRRELVVITMNREIRSNDILIE